MMQGVLDLDSLPLGYRFLPTDKELICYLTGKVRNIPLPLNKIQEVNICLHNPDKLAELYGGGRREMEAMYFFSPSLKYYKGTRSNRAAGTGHWRATGGEKRILTEVDKKIKGYVRALEFREGLSKNKSQWLMQEYRVGTQKTPGRLHDSTKLDDWVLCKIYETKRKTKEQDIPSPCTLLPKNQVPAPINGFDGGNYHDMSNALNSSCQFDQHLGQILVFGHDQHHDPTAFENTGLHNVALPDSSLLPTNQIPAPINGCDGGNYNSSRQFDQHSGQISAFRHDQYHDPTAFENTGLHNDASPDPSFNNTRADDHGFAAQVPDSAMNYDPFDLSGLPPDKFSDPLTDASNDLTDASNDQYAGNLENTGDMVLQINTTDQVCLNLHNFDQVENFESLLNDPEFREFLMNCLGNEQ